jgi:hypothetical protein
MIFWFIICFVKFSIVNFFMDLSTQKNQKKKSQIFSKILFDVKTMYLVCLTSTWLNSCYFCLFGSFVTCCFSFFFFLGSLKTFSNFNESKIFPNKEMTNPTAYWFHIKCIFELLHRWTVSHKWFHIGGDRQTHRRINVANFNFLIFTQHPNWPLHWKHVHNLEPI